MKHHLRILSKHQPTIKAPLINKLQSIDSILITRTKLIRKHA